MRFLQNWISFRKSQSGATAIEYGLMAAGLAFAIMIGFNSLGSNLDFGMKSIDSAFKNDGASGEADFSDEQKFKID